MYLKLATPGIITAGVIALLTVFITSCSATGPAFKKVIHPKSDHSILYIYRPDRFASGGLVSIFILDGKTISRLNNNGYTWLSLQPGNYSLSQSLVSSSWFGDNPINREIVNINFSAEAGKSYYVRFESIVSTILEFDDILLLVDSKLALQEIKTCKFQEPENVLTKTILKIK